MQDYSVDYNCENIIVLVFRRCQISWIELLKPFPLEKAQAKIFNVGLGGKWHT
jgi:hypothetical protein